MINKYNIAAVALVSAISMNAAYAEDELTADSFDSNPMKNGNVFSVAEMEYVNGKAIEAVAAIQDEAFKLQEDYENSLAGFAIESSKSAGKWVGGKLYENASYYGRFVAAWNVNYYFIDGLETATAYAIGAGATAIGGPAAGTSAFYATKSAIRAARWVVPGFEGYFSGSLAPITKTVIIDPIVDYGPAVAKSVYGAAKTAASGVASKASDFYNWWTGKAA